MAADAHGRRTMKNLTYVLALVLVPSALLAQAPAAPEKKGEPAPAAAALTVGLAAENNDIKDPQTSFTLEGDTKIYAGGKVIGAAGDYTLSFKKGDSIAYEKKISVPSTPYRVWTWKTFRKGDEGDWTAVLTGPDGVSSSADFKVAFK
jgi:hypothetical protein